MLTREKIILSLLTQVAKPLSRTVFVKLVFLLRHETTLQDTPSFYDFVPYNFGPFSFTLYWELERLRQYGYVTIQEEHVALCEPNLDRSCREAKDLPTLTIAAVAQIVRRYGRRSQKALVSDVYRRYPWFALNSQLPERKLVSLQRPEKAPPAVYTAGYEGQSVDAFFNLLLKLGIDVLIDVRANPISRKYGFAGARLGQFCERLGLEYCHVPSLGIPSNARTGLSNFASYQRLLSRYERLILAERCEEVKEVGQFMCRRPSVLMCVEKDVHCCHRGRLADAVADTTGLEVVHL